jgi:hypothetical protein
MRHTLGMHVPGTLKMAMRLFARVKGTQRSVTTGSSKSVPHLEIALARISLCSAAFFNGTING